MELLGYSFNNIYGKTDPPDPLDPNSRFFPGGGLQETNTDQGSQQPSGQCLSRHGHCDEPKRQASDSNIVAGESYMANMRFT